VATIFLLIAVSGSPAWLDALVYVTVAVTVLSGVEYFFGLRRTLAARSRERAKV
jgi:CDP-diacylglycerol--glycerol-3-phosphate 3-phosphatidyltransferase